MPAPSLPRLSWPLILSGLGAGLLFYLVTHSWGADDVQPGLDVERTAIEEELVTEDLIARPGPVVGELRVEEPGAPVPRELVPTAQPSTRELTPFDYGVRGRVHYDRKRFSSALTGTVKAIDSQGAQVSDVTDRRGLFQLYELAPGPWTIVVDLGVAGHAEAQVLLTPEAPEASLELWPVAATVVEVEVRCGPRPERLRGRDLNSMFLVAHTARNAGQQCVVSDLDPLASSSMNFGPYPHGLIVFSAQLRLPRDEPLQLSLFADGLWLESRVREAGESHIEWTLGPGRWPPAAGTLEISVVDESRDEVLDYGVQAVGWLARRGIPTRDSVSTRFEDVPPGWRQIEVGGGPFERIRAWFFVAPGSVVEETIALQQAISIAGRTLGPRGDPVQGTLGLWRLDDQGMAQPQTYSSARSDFEGQFRFSSLRAGDYLLRCTGDGAYASGFVEVHASEHVRDLRVELHPASTLLLVRSRPFVGALAWHVEDSEGRWLSQGTIDDIAPRRVLLPPGRLQLVAESDGTGVRSWSLEMGAETQRIDL